MGIPRFRWKCLQTAQFKPREVLHIWTFHWSATFTSVGVPNYVRDPLAPPRVPSLTPPYRNKNPGRSLHGRGGEFRAGGRSDLPGNA